MIREFALSKPVFRIVANTQASMGATGYTTGLAPSMSLGCGAYAGNITSVRAGIVTTRPEFFVEFGEGAASDHLSFEGFILFYRAIYPVNRIRLR